MEQLTNPTEIKDNVLGNGRPPQSGHANETSNSVLTEEMLARFASRAANYDRENRFFEEDFEELRAAKYLLMPVDFEGSRGRRSICCRPRGEW